MPKSFVLVVAAYAVSLIAGGGVAFVLAPEKSAAVTALAVPGGCAVLMLVCAGLAALLPKSRPAGMIGIHVGLVLPLVFAVAFAQRGYASFRAAETYGEQAAQYEAYVSSLPTGDTPMTYDAYVESEGGDPELDHDKTYLAVILGVLALDSVLAFVLLLGMRPKPADRGAPAA